MRVRLLACVLLSLATGDDALANGTAQPDTVSFFADATAPGDFAMNTTFGFLFSEDGGETWEWTCHEAVIGSAPFTPGSWRSPNGAYYVTTPLLLGTDPGITLWRTGDRGCTWTGTESLRNEAVRALAFRPGDDTAVIAVGSRTGGIAAAWRSTDAGLTFGAPLLEVPDHVFNTVHFAPSDPQRLYVAALKQTVPQDSTLYRSADGGANWTAIPFTQFDQPPIRVLAVDPVNADVVWLRNDSATDRVFRSTNGGLVFSLVYSVDTDIVGMALTDAGATQWLAVSRTDGLLHATTASPEFLPVTGSPIARCVEAEGDAVYVCAHPYQDPYSAAVTFDGGATFDSAMTFQRITGPRTGCDADSSHVALCEQLWPAVRTNLGLDGATPTPSPTPTPRAGDGGGGCSCSFEPGAPAAGSAWLLAGAAIALAIRRHSRL